MDKLITAFDYNISLIGFMGSGKSTIARSLKSLYWMDIVEMDSLISQREGLSIPEIFEKKGEEYFRGLETALLKEFSKTRNQVISCGGGVPLRQENVDIMRGFGKIVLLNAAPETIYQRVRKSKDRPLLNNNMNIPHIKELMGKRQDKYLAAADIIIQTDGKSADEISREIVDTIAG